MCKVICAAILLACPMLASAVSTRIEDNLESAVPPYLDATLAVRVAKLQQDIIADPTDTGDELLARAPVLWDWVNAYALTGRPIHPDLTTVIGAMMRSRGTPEQATNFGPILDRAVAEISFRDANPDAIGTLSTDSLGPWPVDSHAEIRQVYTVGSAPIGKGGGLLVTSRMYAGSLDIQVEDPTGPGYVTVVSDNPAVIFELDEIVMSGMLSGRLGGTRPRPFFRVASGTLQPGDRVTITIGDRTKGGPGILLPPQSSSAMRYPLFVSFGSKEEIFPLRELPFVSEGLETVAVRGFGPSIARPGEPARLTVRAEDKYRNRATSGFSRYDIYDGDQLVRRLYDTAHAYHEFELSFDTPGVHYLTLRSPDGSLEGEFNPILVTAEATDQIFWGETHGHTGFAEGAGTVSNFFRFAREDARLDFMTLSEHDIWMDDGEWEVLRDHVREGYRPGRFLTYLGYEWTAAVQRGGHHNVLFRTFEGRDRVESQRAPVIGDLHRLLQVENNPADVLVIPHAHNPGRWWQSDPAVENLVEIVSNHGTFEWLGRAYHAEGYHLGFIGGSDDHIGHPGLRPLSTQSGSDNFGGMAAVLSPRLDRDLVFNRLKARRTYATNGQRIILQQQANGASMGAVIERSRRVEISGRAVGTGPITYIDLIKNGEQIERMEFLAPSSQPTGRLEVRFYSETDPYERNAHSRTHRPWRGTVKVEGARLIGVETPNVENVYTESARISDDDPGKVEFFMRTRGAYRSIVLLLEDVSQEARIAFEADSRGEQVEASTGIHRLNQDGFSIDARIGPHADEVLVRWISAPAERDRPFAFADRRAAPGDVWYVRVTQDNGGMAWSSPVKMAQ